MLMLAKCNLPFCRSSEEFSKDNKGNFLCIIQLLAKYDTVLNKLSQVPKGLWQSPHVYACVDFCSFIRFFFFG